MKILTILYILLQINTFNYGNYSSSNSNNRYSGGNVPVEQTYRGIGYSTNYANGQFNSGVYKSSMTSLEYQNRSFTGTYTPAASSSGGNRPGGKPRKIVVYSGSDDETGQNTPGGNSDSGDWLYEYDSSTGEWWCSKDGGNTWYKWESWLGWGLLGFDWRPGRGDPTENATHYHHDKNNSWVTPIGDAIVPLLILLHLYIGYDVFKKNRKKA